VARRSCPPLRRTASLCSGCPGRPVPYEHHHAGDRHLEVLSASQLAALLGCGLWQIQHRTDLPAPLRLGTRDVYFRSEIERFLPPPRPYSDLVNAEELGALLSCAQNTIYVWARKGIIPRPHRVPLTGKPTPGPGRRRRRTVWSRVRVETHLRALPRIVKGRRHAA